MPISDISLLERWVLYRDSEAFSELVTRHASMVFATCKRIVSGAASAEDLSQECFVRFSSLSSSNMPKGQSLAGWLDNGDGPCVMY